MIVPRLFSQSSHRDLSNIKPQLINNDNDLFVSTPISTPLGAVNKTLKLSLKQPLITIEYQFNFDTAFFGSMKVGNITALPEAFDPDSLYFSACNGGNKQERFHLNADLTFSCATLFCNPLFYKSPMFDHLGKSGTGRRQLSKNIGQILSKRRGLEWQ